MLRAPSPHSLEKSQSNPHFSPVAGIIPVAAVEAARVFHRRQMLVAARVSPTSRASSAYR